MTSILPLQQNFGITDPKTGFFTVYFKRWADQILARIGGITGGSYSKLAITAGTILWDLNSSPNGLLVLGNGVNVLSVPLNQVAGLTYSLTIIQPASGAAGTISWPKPPFLFPGGVAPTLTVANNGIDRLQFFSDGTSIYLMVEGINYS